MNFTSNPKGSLELILSVKESDNCAHSFTIFDAELGLHKNEEKSPYLYYPSSCKTHNKSNAITRRDQHLHLLQKSITDLIIPKVSDTGKIILDAWEEYKGFASKYQDDLAPVNFDEIVF